MAARLRDSIPQPRRALLVQGHQTELETWFDFGWYNYAAPDGAGQVESSPAFQGWVVGARLVKVPRGTTGRFFRPGRDLVCFRMVNPAINGWAIFNLLLVVPSTAPSMNLNRLQIPAIPTPA